jgi:hypothetical protein
MDKRPCTPMKGAVNCTPNQLARFISSLALEEASLPTSSSATGLWAPSRSTPTASGCSCNARPMGASPGSPSLATSDTSTAIHGAAMSISSAPASHASHGAWPGSGEEHRMSATSGLTPTGLFVRYDPATCCWNKFQISLFTRTLEPYSGTWPAHGMMRSGQCWELATWVLPTVGNASGYSWPTVRSTDGERGGRGDLIQAVRGNPNSHYQMWPTPQTTYDGATDEAWLARKERAHQKHARGEYGPGTGAPGMFDLARAARLWPTPNVPNGGRTTWHAEQQGNSYYHDGKKVQLGLEQAVRLWATPSARDWRSGHASQETLEGNSRPLNEQVTATTGQGQLNPNFVEYLMAWPQGWTDGDGPLNPQTSHVWQQVFRTALIAYVPWAMGGSPYARP